MLRAILDRFRRAKADPEDVARVKAWAAAALGLSDDDQITVNEIACTDPACPGLETVLLIMREGEKTRAVKIAGSLVALTRPLVEKAVLERGR